MRPMIPTVMIAVLAHAATAGGQPRPELDPDMEIAHRHFNKGGELYSAGNYEGALGEFEAAQQVKPLAAFDFNIGRCLDRLERPAEAIQAYRRYLASSPDTPDAASVRERVSVLEQRVQRSPTQRRAEPPPAPPAQDAQRPLAPVVAPSPVSRASIVAPVTIGVAALVLAVVGTALVATVDSPYQHLLEQWKMQRTAELQQQARNLQIQADVGYALLALAGAVAVVDLVLWAVRSRGAGEPRPGIAASFEGFNAQVRF